MGIGAVFAPAPPLLRPVFANRRAAGPFQYLPDNAPVLGPSPLSLLLDRPSGGAVPPPGKDAASQTQLVPLVTWDHLAVSGSRRRRGSADRDSFGRLRIGTALPRRGDAPARTLPAQTAF